MANGMRSAEDADWREREKREAKAKQSKTIKTIELGRNVAGDHVVTHHFDNDGPGPYREAEKKTFKPHQGKKLVAHLVEHAGIDMGGKEDGGDDE